MIELSKGEGMQISSSGYFVSSVEGGEKSLGKIIEDMQNRIAALEETVTTQEAMIDAIQATANTALDKLIIQNVVEGEKSISKVVTEPGIITASVNKK